TEIIPAPAQGVLAVQIRESDTELFHELQKIHDKKVATAIAVERKVLNLFEGGCHMPLGCYCYYEHGQFHVWTAKANSGDDFPDRLFVRSEDTEDLAEKIVAKFSSD